MSSGTLTPSKGFSRDEKTFRVGLFIMLMSWSMMFITILWGYLVYRWRARVWFEGVISRDLLAFAVANTMLVLLAGWALRVFGASYVRDVQKKMAGLAICSGIGFLAGQAFLWVRMMERGLSFKESMAGSFFFLMTGFHAVHIVGALAAVAIAVRRYLVQPDLQSRRFLTGVTYFWDFLAVIWAVMFILIFIIR